LYECQRSFLDVCVLAIDFALEVVPDTLKKVLEKTNLTKDEVDYFYTSWNNYGFLIPINEVSTEKYLRVKPPKTGIQSTMSIASDYLIDNVIEAIKTQTPI
jgi:hypothetical protein